MSKIHLRSPEGKRFALFHPGRAKKEDISIQDQEAFEAKNKAFATKRIEQIRTALREIQQKFPDVIGLCIYGSTVKGTLREQTKDVEGSDLDGFVYVDATEHQTVAIRVAHKSSSISSTMVRFEKAEQDTYEKSIREIIKKNLEFDTQNPTLDNEKVEHIGITPISKAIIDQQVQDILPWAKKMVEYRRQKTVTPDIDSPSTNISDMFHLAVGKGIEKYRTYLISQLQKEGEAGEIIWQNIILGIEYLEQNFSVGDLRKNYPWTLAEASHVYGHDRTLVDNKVGNGKKRQ